MKMMMDERLKHRLVGLAVVLSVVTIFLPAVMKKSNDRFDKKTILSIKLPAKPSMPVVAIPKEQALFHSVKVAHVEIAPVKEESRLPSAIVKAEPLSQPLRVVSNNANLSQKPLATKALVALKPRMPLPAVDKKKTLILKSKAKVASTVAASANYSVQLATFSQQSNALSLMNKLKNKGYKPVLGKRSTKNGIVYQVFVGQVSQKQQAQLLQQQLASQVQLQGLVVASTGIS